MEEPKTALGRQVMQLAKDLQENPPERYCDRCRRTDRPLGRDEYGGLICSACQERMEVVQAEQRLRDAEVPARYKAATSDHVDAPTWDKIRKWIDSDDWALTILGPTGCGKSYLAAAVLSVLCHRKGSLTWWSMPALLDRLKDFERVGDLMERTIQCSTLVLDDLAAERLTDFGLDRVATLIQARYDGCRRTIVTTNLTPQALAELHGRMASRLLGTGDGATVIKLTGADRRLKRGKEKGGEP